MVYMKHIFFTHLSVDGHLGCSHVLALVNSTIMNIWLHVSFLVIVLSEYMPKSGITESYGNSMLGEVTILMTKSLGEACGICVGYVNVS